MKSTFCIDSVASFNEINANPTNKSKTKQTFSFSKSQRFQQTRPLCEKSTYGGDFITHKTNGAGIGYGTRSDFTKCTNVAPPSTKYDMKSQWEQNLVKKRGNSLGLSRQKVKFSQYIPEYAQKIPSATHYQSEKVSNKFSKAPSFTFRTRTKIHDRSMTLDPESYNPGPGNYNSVEESKATKFSKITYGTSKSRRFDSADNKIPGAGHYNTAVQLSNTGKYSNSKYMGGTQAKFNRTPRMSFVDEFKLNDKSQPGPGNYRSPSEFGQYDGNVYGVTALGRFTKKRK